MLAKRLLIVILLVASFLRLWGLTINPVALFGDELDVGYQAYSILKTGRDYSGSLMPLHFHSFADWRTPLYLYSAVPTVAIFGITPLGVRLPAALFGILGVLAMYLFVKEAIESLGIKKAKTVALLSSFFLAISPWHIQYSRAGFEVTLLLLFILLGLYNFFRSLKTNGEYLWISVSFLVLTPWVYSTAKLFVPILLLILFILWRREIFVFSRKNIKKSVIAGLIFGLPISFSILFGGGADRFGYISVFKDPTTVPEVGFARLQDARVRGETGEGLQPTFIDRVIHNKYTLWTERITDNYFESFSTNFLFINGDPNPRHSVFRVGEFFKIDFLALILGVIFFFTKFKEKRIKILFALWFVVGALPAAITQGGGSHATRLILMLPAYIFLIAFGVYSLVRVSSKSWKKLLTVFYFGVLLVEFIFYQHNYWAHYPRESERWWHYGWKEAISFIKDNSVNYERVFITMADEPAWIFFIANYPYPPNMWHEGFPLKNTEIEGFGGMSYIDKFYFGSPDENGASIYDLPKFITQSDLYLASSKEVPGNLIMDPSRTPIGLKLIDSVAFPSGEPAFYIFTKQ